ncbi:LOW QUALITY PROTEIN: protein FRA10AC1-like [Stegodyphus dumicola]|uniref:LOW QUALITY PROTEIN: protein FRA10AC1-like n=1 Tax=Stegodyphus dumicola TaxID=202533 RepID=UPI0015B07F65|nr:LOW QUALITY PROTEIN: protein FRA10AC1-like [Stegodyphus dumicola]
MAEAGSSSQQIPYNEDYESDFEYDAEVGEKRKARYDLAIKAPETKLFKPNRQAFHDECSREQGRIQQKAFLALDAYSRHKKLINDYVLCYRGTTSKLKRDTSHYKTDHDIIKENHRFLWEDDDETHTWGEKLAKKYYDRLFREYCLCDLSYYRKQRIGLRWRTENELVIGKGQFFCGSIHCNENDNLNSWEIRFGYVEHGESKSALVTLRLCEKCSYKLNYGYKGKAVLKKKRHAKPEETRKEETMDSIDSSIVTENVVKQNTDETEVKESDVWKQPVTEEIDQSKEDAFEEFLEELLL